MGNNRSSHKLTEDNIREISEETGFSQKQLDRLWDRFSSLDKYQKGYLAREDFLRIPELAINPLGDRIVHAFFSDGKLAAAAAASAAAGPEKTSPFGIEEEEEQEQPGGDVVNFRDFVRVLSHFRPIKKDVVKNKLNLRQDKLRFAFRMYDLDGDDKISKEELLAVLTMMVGANISPEQLRSITERTVLEADMDQDGFISFEEYCKVLERIDIEQKMSIRFLS